MQNEYPYRGRNRFQTPSNSGQIVNPYDIDSALLQDLIQRDLAPVAVQSINLGTAGTLSIPHAGYHFVIYGNDGSAIKTVNTTALVNVWINKKANDGSTPFPAKHARGFSGPFASLYLEWPAQTSAGNPVFCDLIVFKSADRPWVDGESAT